MRFFLSSPEFSISFDNLTKVTVNLRSGKAEILENHQELLGIISNNLLEIETSKENKIEKYSYILQEGMLTVLPKDKQEPNETLVTVFAKNVCSLQSSVLDDLIKKYEEKNEEIKKEKTKFLTSEDPTIQQVIQTKLLLLEQELEFAKQCVNFAKILKA